MANVCDTSYKVRGSRKVVNDLWNTLLLMEVNSKEVYLYQLAKHYGIDYEKKNISVRGVIYWAELEDNEGDNYSLLSFDTETAWSACTDFFKELNKTLGNELSISYREIECGCEIYCVHDEGNYFPEECCINSSGKPFNDVYGDAYCTIGEAIKEWCSKTGISQGSRTDDEMVNFINEYEYEMSDTYFNIHPFIFE